MTFIDKPLTKTDLEDFISWLASKPRNEGYIYGTPTQCLVAQYLNARDFKDVLVTVNRFRANGNQGTLPESLNSIAYGYPRTFGAAFNRARAILITDYDH